MPRTGRPEINDDATLLAIAVVVKDEPGISIAAAVRKVKSDFATEQSEEAAIRRLRDKFNGKQPELMDQILALRSPLCGGEDTMPGAMGLAYRQRLGFPTLEGAAQMSRIAEQYKKAQACLAQSNSKTSTQRLTEVAKSLNSPNLRKVFDEAKSASRELARAYALLNSSFGSHRNGRVNKA